MWITFGLTIFINIRIDLKLSIISTSDKNARQRSALD